MIVDIGGGTTEVAVISLGGIVINHSIRIAGDEIDEAIIQYARREHNLLIGERMAEKAKIAAGSAYPLDEEMQVTLRGRDLLTGLPKAVEVCSVEIARGDLRPGDLDRRRGQAGPGGDPARTGGRHHGARHHAGGRRRAAPGPGPPPASRDQDAGPHRRRSARPAWRAAPGASSKGWSNIPASSRPARCKRRVVV